MKNLNSRIISLLGAVLYTLMACVPAMADDTEVLIGPGGVAWSKPNVLFIMDTSGSMGRDVDGNDPPAAGQRSRLAIVQDVFRDLMNSNSGLNVGLMRFSSNGQGGYFVSPMQDLGTSTRSDIIAASDAFTDGGNTPLSETLYEATRFYRGMSVDYGDRSSPGTNHTDVFDDGNYISPITSQCQKNYVILLTDGQPVSDNNANDSIETLTGSSCSGNCLDEVAGFLHTTDQNPDIPGTQTVETYTIGFTTNQALLQDTATDGGGDYIVADNADELSAAFNSILESITGTNDTFSPPALAANAFNNISHYNRLYYALFEPAASSRWEGNVKPYTLAGSPPVLTDASGNVAVDNNGFFLESSRSFWSSNPDGGSITDGGANSRLPTASNRNLYTFTGTYNGGVPNQPLLSDSRNALEVSPGSDLDASMLGLSNPDANALQDEFENIISTTRASTLSDSLHSKPVLVHYGGSEDNPDLTLFAATNAGFLHAFNASTGEEQFAFIPQELLPNLPTLARGTGSHPYGLDGDVTAWINDINGDGDVNDDNEHAYVYVGMRRGGNNYYALDVTNRDAPRLKWVIKGGTGDFAELGQSWSRPAVATIEYGNSIRTVLIFAGGYDTAQDGWPVDQPDTIGRAIYIVDAASGEKLFEVGPGDSAGNPDLVLNDMKNSIPSDVRLIDSDIDSHTDRLYVGDMDGKLFRVDLQATSTGITGSGVLLADLGSADETDAANNRRFYYPPDIVLAHQPGVPAYLAVNIGSGYRAHPLNPLGENAVRVNDRFYSIRDPYVIGEVPGTFTEAVRNNDLFDASTDMVSTDSAIENLANSNGWFVTLGNGNGEKVLAPSITVNNVIYFTTYTPPASVETSNCAPPPGTGRLYRVNLFNARPALADVAIDGDGGIEDPSEEDRAEVLDRTGIPSGPVIKFREITNDDGTLGGSELLIGVDTTFSEVPEAISMQKTYWKDDPSSE